MCLTSQLVTSVNEAVQTLCGTNRNAHAHYTGLADWLSAGRHYLSLQSCVRWFLCCIVTMAAAQSLVTAIDELVSITTVVTTGYEHDESEFIKFVQNQEECRKKWQVAERRASDLSEVNNQLERRVSELSEGNNSMSVQLKHARSMVHAEMTKRQRAEGQMEYLVRHKRGRQ